MRRLSPRVLLGALEETNVSVLLEWEWEWAELPHSPVTTRPESRLWRETLSLKQIQEVDITRAYLLGCL